MQNAQGVTYLQGDHLGSTSVTSEATSSTQVYYPFGAVRVSSGTVRTLWEAKSNLKGRY